jgi:hypothetical protein
MAKCSIGWAGLFLASISCVLGLLVAEPALADSEARGQL